MENQNLNFDYVVGMFNQAAETIKQLRLEREFLEVEIKELKEELINDIPILGILKPDEAKELMTNFFLEEFDKDGLVQECEDACTIESEDYGDYVRIDKNVSSYDIENKVERELKGLVKQFFESFKDRFYILDIKEEEEEL